VGKTWLKLVIAHLLLTSLTLGAKTTGTNERHGYPITDVPASHLCAYSHNLTGQLMPWYVG
jgi:hypothetical protein